MLTSLDLLIIVYLIMIAAGLLALCLMFLARRPLLKKVCFYFVSALGIYTASVGIRIGFVLFPVQAAIGVLAGLASIVAILLSLKYKNEEKKLRIVRILAAAALVVGLINTIL